MDVTVNVDSYAYAALQKESHRYNITIEEIIEQLIKDNYG